MSVSGLLHPRHLSALSACVLVGAVLWSAFGQSEARSEISSLLTEAYQWDLPQWAPEPIVPPDNPMSREKVELGRHLFYDKRLSSDASMSCATCHQQEKAFTDGKARSEGVDGTLGGRSAMSLVNAGYLPVLTWMNPNLNSLEIQSLIPIFGEHPVEMGMAGREELLFERLKAEPRYRKLFTDAFPNESTRGDESLYSLSTVTKALAAFQRSLVSFGSAFDQYRYEGKTEALSASAKRGESLFFGEKMECYHCHGGLNFNDNIQHSRMPFPELGFHNTGLYNIDGKGSYPKKNPGIIEITGLAGDTGKFRTPTLRNIALTAPYMHDGSIPTLAEVIRSHYARAGRASMEYGQPNPLRSEFLQGFEVTDQEVADLVVFLESLTDTAFIANPRHGDPWGVVAQ
ncbi:MAG: Cytochrome peroxidase precursor [Pseudomonadota bacterium]